MERTPAFAVIYYEQAVELVLRTNAPALALIRETR
jgi:hypothetical protein